MKHVLYREQQLECSMETAWNFFSSATNILKITPKEMNFKLLTSLEDDSVYEGMIIDYYVSPLLGISMRWTTEITEVKMHKSFTDVQKKGPYKIWKHQHQFFANEKGVLMTDTVDYQLPFGIIGDWAHTLFVKKKVNTLFDYREQMIARLLKQKS